MIGLRFRSSSMRLACACAALLMCCRPGEAADDPSLPKTESIEPVSFVRDVVPMLTKLGCNGGACHGAFQGRGGFRLSLWGFDPSADYAAIVTEDRGRRVFAAAPESSFVLLKPTLALPHAGGRRLKADTEEYEILRGWIAGGHPAPTEGDPSVVRLKVEPGELVLDAGERSSLRVEAVWSDGEVRDVTRWARFDGPLEQVARVSADGQVEATGPGRTSVLVLYGGQAEAVRVTIPYGETADIEFSGSGFIDRHIAAEWKVLGLRPAPLCGDAEFMRRVHLDLIGTLPTPDEVKRFLASSESDKRGALVHTLLDRPEYADFWSLVWSDRLKVHRRALGEKGLASFTGWLRQALRENRPFDSLVRELLTAQGNLYTTGPVAFYFIDRTPEELTETTAQVFLGVRLQCARCHHHPFEVWSQDDYYGLAAFFSRVQRKDTKEGGRFGGAQSVRLASSGAIHHPVTGRPMAPRVLAGESLQPADGDERTLLAEWITDPKNPWFARSIVNRYWGDLLGRGLVHPVDDLRATNPPSHPALLSELAEDFVAHGCDVKHLLRTICTSHMYQLAGEVAPTRDIDGMFYTHRRPRRLTAEVLLDAINQAAGTTEPFEKLPPGTRAISLPDPAVQSYFLDVFGRPLRVSACACERPERMDLRQVLRLANSETLHAKITAPAGRLTLMLAADRSDREIVEELYLATVSRMPTDEEVATASGYIAAAPSRNMGCEDLLWALLNLPEFLFNH